VRSLQRCNDEWEKVERRLGLELAMAITALSLALAIAFAWYGWRVRVPASPSGGRPGGADRQAGYFSITPAGTRERSQTFTLLRARGRRCSRE